jgi:hypothetical protein
MRCIGYLGSHDCNFRSPLMKTLDWSVETLGLDYNSTGLCNHLFNQSNERNMIDIPGCSERTNFKSIRDNNLFQTCHNNWEQAVRTHPDIGLTTTLLQLVCRSVYYTRKNLTSFASLPTSRQQVVFALLVPSCQQV